MVRGAAPLPVPVGKPPRICVFADGLQAEQARAAGGCTGIKQQHRLEWRHKELRRVVSLCAAELLLWAGRLGEGGGGR